MDLPAPAEDQQRDTKAQRMMAAPCQPVLVLLLFACLLHKCEGQNKAFDPANIPKGGFVITGGLCQEHIHLVNKIWMKQDDKHNSEPYWKLCHSYSNTAKTCSQLGKEMFFYSSDINNGGKKYTCGWIMAVKFETSVSCPCTFHAGPILDAPGVVPFYTDGTLVQWHQLCNKKFKDMEPPTVACSPGDKTEGLCVPLSAEHQKENEEHNVIVIIFCCICTSPIVACHMKRKKMGCFAPKQGAETSQSMYIAAQ